MDLSTLLTDVRHEAPGAPDLMLKRVMRLAAKDFFKRSGVWRLHITGVTDANGQIDVSAQLDAVGASAFLIRKAILVESGSRHPLRVMSEGERHLWGAETGTIQAVELEYPNIVHAFPINEGETIQLEIAVHNNRSTTAIPDAMGERYGDAIVNKTIGNLLTMSNQSWTNQNRGFEYLNEYERDIHNAQIEANHWNRTQMGGVAYGGL